MKMIMKMENTLDYRLNQSRNKTKKSVLQNDASMMTESSYVITGFLILSVIEFCYLH